MLATQNPIEQEGTYPLPEAQLDRFMFQIDVGYPSAEEEVRIVNQTTTAYRPTLRKVLSPERILELQDAGAARAGRADTSSSTRSRSAAPPARRTPTAPEFVSKYVSWGAGPRASQYLVLAAKARAILRRPLRGRHRRRPRAGAAGARHRVLPNFHAEADGVTARALVERLVDAIRP